MFSRLREKPVTPTDEPLSLEQIPRHIAIIMDGNGRWAKSHGMPRNEGHRQGKDNLRRIVEACVEFGIPVLTIYAFSTENWSRPPSEVGALLTILELVLDQEVEKLHKNGVQVRHIGSLEGVTPKLQEKIRKACAYTQNNNRLVLNVAFNYGGRDEIVRAVQRIVREGIPAAQVNEELISRYLYTGELPDPDLIIRTSGELRISNFLIWQAAYSEYYVTPTYWPDFDKDELRKALIEYSMRKRRFGRTDEQIESNEQ
jgi:undecaprenyl diphosphate synthase